MFDYLKRHPHTVTFGIRIILYVVTAILARETIDPTLLATLLLGAIGADLTATKTAESKTTVISDPKLADSKDIPPELKAAALAVQTLLPGSIGGLFETYGAEGLWALVKTAEKALSRPLSSEELKAARDEARGAL